MKSKWKRLKRFSKQCWRVLKVIKKPGKEEYLTIVKVTGLGIAIVGTLGLIISMVDQTLIG